MFLIISLGVLNENDTKNGVTSGFLRTKMHKCVLLSDAKRTVRYRGRTGLCVFFWTVRFKVNDRGWTHNCLGLGLGKFQFCSVWVTGFVGLPVPMFTPSQNFDFCIFEPFSPFSVLNCFLV